MTDDGLTHRHFILPHMHDSSPFQSSLMRNNDHRPQMISTAEQLLGPTPVSAVTVVESTLAYIVISSVTACRYLFTHSFIHSFIQLEHQYENV